MQKAAASWATGGALLELVRASGGDDDGAGDVGAGDDGARDGDVDDDGAGDVGDIGLEGLDLEETCDQHDHGACAADRGMCHRESGGREHAERVTTRGAGQPRHVRRGYYYLV